MSRLELHCELTDLIIEKLAQQIPLTRILWDPAVGTTFHPPLRFNGERFRGGNLLQLILAAGRRGYQSPYWMTKNQGEKLGAELRQNAVPTGIFYCGRTERLVKQSNGEREAVMSYFERRYDVFNADQFRGLPLRFHAAFQTSPEPELRAYRSARFFRAVGAQIRYGSSRAYYNPREDLIVMPRPESFVDPEAFEAVLCHEHMHWTGHASRLHRLKSTICFESPEYAREELIAELGSVFLCLELGITPVIRDDHIVYLDSWLEILQHDQRAIYSAASRASDAVEYLHSFQLSHLPATYVPAENASMRL